MCPISGLVQLLIVVVSLLLICQGVIAQTWNVRYSHEEPTIHMYDSLDVQFNVTGPDISSESQYYQLLVSSEDEDILEAEKEVLLHLPNDKFYTGTFTIKGNFLGKSNVSIQIKDKGQTKYRKHIPVKVIRQKRVIDTIFTASVATLVSIMYINFGCALNWNEIKTCVKKPIGPSIGFIGQFVFMPVISYVLAKIIFPSSVEMQLGMFFTGVSPSGGASNMWALILEGNINLSITMTTISTFAAFGMMPLWIFTLGRGLFDQGNLMVPYKEISTYAVALVVPLFIGFLIQRYLKKVGQFLARILKGFSSLLLIFIIVFAIVTNLYLFELFSWQIIIAGLGLPWLGYTLAFVLAKALRQSTSDSLTIAIETGIQNTGIAIFLLRFSLPQPEADLTTVAPVCVAIMTPIPLLCLFIYQKIRNRYCLPPDKMRKLEIEGSQKCSIDDNCNKETLISTIT